MSSRDEKIEINAFSKCVMEILEEYGDEARHACLEEIGPAIKTAKAEVKRLSPKRSGEYRKNWKSTTVKGRLTVAGTIYNDYPTYRLTHLLENGHLTRAGTRVKPVEHIAPAQKKAEEEFIKKIEERLQ